MPLRCLLVSANTATVPYPVYPLGLAHLDGALNRAGFVTRLYDALAAGGFDGLACTIEEFSPDLIALSIRNLDNVDSTDPVSFIGDAKHAVSIIRNSTSAPVVAGGPAFSLFPQRFMELLRVEWGVVGEGEAALVDIARRLEQGSPPPNGIVTAGMVQGQWGEVRYDAPTASYYLSRGGMLNMQSKRGCPYRCTYCSYPLIEGRRIRYRDPEEVANDAIMLARKHGVRYLFFTDAVFNDPAGRYMEVVEALIRAGNSTPWCAFFRPSGISRTEMRIMKRSGLSGMELGTDGATDQALEGLGKGFSFDEVEALTRMAVEEEIPCAHFCMFGGPGETAGSVREGISNLERLKETVVFGFAGIRILPGTTLCDIAKSQGMLTEGDDIFEPLFYFAPGLDFPVVDRMLRDAWRSRLDRIYPCSILYEHMNRLYTKGYSGPLWDILVRH